MSQDVFTEVTPLRGGGCGGGILATLLGVILIAVAFYILFTNERDAVSAAQALERGSRMVVSVNPGVVLPANNGRLVHVTGFAHANAPVIDPIFHVATNGLKLKRKVEMYQWQEEQSTEKELYRQVTTYRYVKEWTTDAVDSRTFRYPQGHKNPAMQYGSREFGVSPVICGAFALSGGLAAQIDDYSPVPVIAKWRKMLPRFSIHDGGLYRGKDPAHPQVGDVRVRFAFAPSSTVSVVAMQKNALLTAYPVSPEGEIALLRVGAFRSGDMFRYAEHQNAVHTWDMRLLGFIVMTTGLFLASQLVLWIFNLIPVVGDFLETLSCLGSLLLALALSLATIAAGWIYYRPVETGMSIACGIILLLTVSWFAKRNRLRRVR